ncbi:MAG: inorganic diphosphatase [Candidatus Binatia bacterium]
MATPIAELAPYDDAGNLRIIVESPAGSSAKLKHNPEHGLFEWVRPLPLGMRFPFDWGFVPGTCAEDGDPVDAVVVTDAPTSPGVLVPCVALGVIEVEQNDKCGGRIRNDRIIARPIVAPRAAHVRTLDDLTVRIVEEIEAFLSGSVRFEPKALVILGRGAPDAALALVDRYRSAKSK